MRYLNNLKQQGFSLIEIMVALVIGMVLLGGAVSVFISNNSVYRLESELSRMQESGRFLIEVMSKEIRMAGYNGCSSRADITPTILADETPPLTISDANALTGYDFASASTWDPVLPGFINAAAEANKTVLDNSDVLIVQRVSECGAQLTADMAAEDADVKGAKPNSCDFVENEVVTITDCKSSDVFAISNDPGDGSGTGEQTIAHANTINSDENLSKTYRLDSTVTKQLSNTFFIADGASGEPAVWIASWTPDTASNFTAFELADGVEQLQILYGEDTGGGNEYADSYVDAATVTDWASVRSVRINLLLSSNDNITTEPRVFMFNGADANTAGDNKLRMAFTSTITLRNRLP